VPPPLLLLLQPCLHVLLHLLRLLPSVLLAQLLLSE
jgi:hypothetical protein